MYLYIHKYIHNFFGGEGGGGSIALEGLGLLLFEVSRRHSGTLGRAPLDEGSASRSDFYLATHNNHMSQTSIPLAGLEPAKPASERPLTQALDRPATGIGYAHVHIKLGMSSGGQSGGH